MPKALGQGKVRWGKYMTINIYQERETICYKINKDFLHNDNFPLKY